MSAAGNFQQIRLDRYIETSALAKNEGLIEKRGLWIIFLLLVNPLTSSGLVSPRMKTTMAAVLRGAK